MRANTGLLGWGLFFIVTGALVLAVNQGVLERGLLAEAWRLWPLVLIGIGMGLLLRDSPLGVLGGFVVAATLAAIAAAALTGGIGAGCGGGNEGAARPFEAQGDLAPDSRVTVDFSCGDLTVSTGPGSGWRLDGRDPSVRPPRTDETAAGLRISPSETGARGLPFFGGAKRTWRLSLPAASSPQEVRLSVSAGTADVDLAGLEIERLAVTTNAADTRLDLEDATIDRLELHVNASATRVRLPSTGIASGSVEVNAGDVDLCRPAVVAIEITARGALADTDFSDDGLARSGDRWRSPGFETAEARVTLTIEANAASVDLDPEGGCG